MTDTDHEPWDSHLPEAGPDCGATVTDPSGVERCILASHPDHTRPPRTDELLAAQAETHQAAYAIAHRIAEAVAEPFDPASHADDLLDAMYPEDPPGSGSGPGGMSHAFLRELAAEPTAARSHFAAELERRRTRAAAALLAVFPHMAAAAIESYEHDIQAAVDELPPHQPVPVDTLRRWAVWSDQIADYSSQRVRRAATGARHLADDIRREIAHPSDQPHAAPGQYLNPHLFDGDREVPGDPEGPAEEEVQA